MKSFLYEVAADLYARYGEGLSECSVLFPSRRARLFFIDALSQIAGRPMWQPTWATIDSLMEDCEAVGICTMPDSEKALLLEEWGRRDEK